jgi:lipid A disaccharide synthetase
MGSSGRRVGSLTYVTRSAELVPHLPRFAARLRNTATAVMAQEPDVLVTVDSKGFNFRLLRRVRQVPNSPPTSRNAYHPGYRCR